MESLGNIYRKEIAQSKAPRVHGLNGVVNMDGPEPYLSLTILHGLGLPGGTIERQAHPAAGQVQIPDSATQVHFCGEHDKRSRHGAELKCIAVGPDADDKLQTGHPGTGFRLQQLHRQTSLGVEGQTQAQFAPEPLKALRQ